MSKNKKLIDMSNQIKNSDVLKDWPTNNFSVRMSYTPSKLKIPENFKNKKVFVKSDYSKKSLKSTN